jgi:hypothetical protein
VEIVLKRRVDFLMLVGGVNLKEFPYRALRAVRSYPLGDGGLADLTHIVLKHLGIVPAR